MKEKGDFMKVHEIISSLSELAPFEYAQGWDNVGLLAGSKEKEVSSVFVAVDATDEVIEKALECGADMLLTHHPMIFSAMKRVVDDDFIGRRIIKLIKSDMAYVAMHTNFDIMGMADAAADELKLRKCEVLHVTFEDEIAQAGLGRIGVLPREMSLREFADVVKITFHVPTVRIYGDPDTPIMKVAILPGSGRSEIDDAIRGGADVFITGDVDHHSGIDALAKGLCVIDAGHYGIEKLFISYMEEFIGRNLKGIRVYKEDIKEPFMVV